MTAKETVTRYLESLGRKEGWQNYFADDMTFTSFTSPPKQVNGRATFLESTKGFYGMIVSLDVREMLTDGYRVFAGTRYQLQPPVGAPFSSDVGELFEVEDGKITSLAIYFDTAPYPRR
jgi:ketosteroid isomerase-like protein